VDLAMIQEKLRRYDLALKGAEKAEQLDPEYVLIDLVRGMVYQAEKDWPHALQALGRAKERMQGAPAVVALMARAEALSGDTASARRDLESLRQASSKMYVPDYLMALVEYALGEVERGRASLKKSIDAHCGLLVWMKTDPVFDQIAADPKGAELMKQIGM